VQRGQRGEPRRGTVGVGVDQCPQFTHERKRGGGRIQRKGRSDLPPPLFGLVSKAAGAATMLLHPPFSGCGIIRCLAG
jgi:hypothetical protein